MELHVKGPVYLVTAATKKHIGTHAQNALRGFGHLLESMSVSIHDGNEFSRRRFKVCAIRIRLRNAHSFVVREAHELLPTAFLNAIQRVRHLLHELHGTDLGLSRAIRTKHSNYHGISGQTRWRPARAAT